MFKTKKMKDSVSSCFTDVFSFSVSGLQGQTATILSISVLLLDDAEASG